MDQNWAEEKKTCNQNGGTRNLLMQYFTPVPYGFICQIKRREKKHRTMKTATVWIARSLRYTKYEETREEGKKPNKKWNETEKETIISKVYCLKGARGNDNILHMNRRAFWSGSWSVSVSVFVHKHSVESDQQQRQQQNCNLKTEKAMEHFKRKYIGLFKYTMVKRNRCYFIDRKL